MPMSATISRASARPGSTTRKRASTPPPTRRAEPMRRIANALLAALAGTCAAAPTAAQETPSNAQVDRSQDAKWMNQQMAALASRQAAEGWRWMEGGLLWRRVAGDG